MLGDNLKNCTDHAMDSILIEVCVASLNKKKNLNVEIKFALFVQVISLVAAIRANTGRQPSVRDAVRTMYANG